MIVPKLSTPEPPTLNEPKPAFPPPLICPELVSVVIKPVFTTPRPAVPSAPAPPLIIPALLRVVIVPRFMTPAPPASCVPASPPLIVAPVLLLSSLIVAPLTFSTPEPPGPPKLLGGERLRRCLPLRR